MVNKPRSFSSPRGEGSWGEDGTGVIAETQVSVSQQLGGHPLWEWARRIHQGLMVASLSWGLEGWPELSRQLWEPHPQEWGGRGRKWS